MKLNGIYRDMFEKQQLEASKGVTSNDETSIKIFETP